MAKDLRKIADRPRENRRSVEFILSMKLDIDNSEGDASEQLKLFKGWVTDTFTKWDLSILENFLYNYNLLQDYDSSKYHLEFKVEGLTEDDSDSQLRPQVLDTLDKIKKDEESDKEESTEEMDDVEPEVKPEVKDSVGTQPRAQRIDFRR